MMRQEGRALFAIFLRNFHLVKRYAGWEVVALFYNVVNTLTIGLIASLTPPAIRLHVVLYLIVGALVWNFLLVLFFEISNSVTWERWEGTIEASFMAPVYRLTYLFGTSAYAVVYALLRTLGVLLAVALFFHLDLRHADLAGALLVFAAASFPFIGLGLMAAVLPLMSAEKGAQATQIIQGLILLVSGVYYPVSVLPWPLRWLSYLSPATYCLFGARAAILGGWGVGRLLPLAGGLFLSGLLLIPLGLFVFHFGERYAMRHGKLKRSG